MESFRLPPVMDFDSGNLPASWKKWQTSFEYFMEATEHIDELESRKVAICLNLIGERGQAIFDTFKVEKKTLKLEKLLDLFKKYCEPKKKCDL